MRILIATPFYPPKAGVLATYAAGFEAAFRKQGHHVDVVSFGSVASLPPGIRHLAYLFMLLARMPHASLAIGLDHWSVGMPAFVAAKLFGVPIALRIGGDFLWESYVGRTKESVLLSEFYDTLRDFSLKERMISRSMRMLIRNADALLFTTRFQKGIWEKAYRFDAARAHIIENFYPSRAGSAQPTRSRVFVHAGREIFLKNSALLHRAFERVKASHPDIGLDERALPHAEHQARVQDSYAVIVASLSEVSSNAAIDAVSLGVPFVCTKDTGTSERLEGCGLFVDTRSEDALARAIESLLEPETYAKLRKNIDAFSYVHSWDDIAHEIVTSVSK
ncbi:hypothetical protein A2765_00385 [Candidatus Kaiserbacteria bacterium RIFCSPHIGHO2_01_FULL_56_24]|uniref:Glycosyl transferase family 1 domain-containing protein n=1 Tax=Candidatus Kaiserbacteria bacterium RIFCSPHIGHO2_01_FULL_56_24 TaxID=1798487 RepID=A0A1F6DBM7_9BACT|nr:MAG: hypothetical protein A2765_00385 [Candidatus Kaiserbacteria bacterium RIFCSPHIGHO2_01_FULL_56_24]